MLGLCDWHQQGRGGGGALDSAIWIQRLSSSRVGEYPDPDLEESAHEHVELGHVEVARELEADARHVGQVVLLLLALLLAFGWGRGGGGVLMAVRVLLAVARRRVLLEVQEGAR
jgi:hypothetical protein